MALNPIIKFTTLFGLLAVELAIEMPSAWWRTALGIRLVCRGRRVYLAIVLRHANRIACGGIPQQTAAPISVPGNERLRSQECQVASRAQPRFLSHAAQPRRFSPCGPRGRP